MAAEIIYGVFVSSTYEDLREERSEVQKVLLRAKCFPIGMELFPSTDEETWEFIKRQIHAADYYLVVIAGRYRRRLVTFPRFHIDGSITTDWQLTNEGQQQYEVLKDLADEGSRTGLEVDNLT